MQPKTSECGPSCMTWRMPACWLLAGASRIDQVEPAHSALVQRWDKLQTWRDEALSYLPLQRDLAAASARAGGGARAFGIGTPSWQSLRTSC